MVNHWLHDFPERIKELYGADAVVQTARSDLIGAGTRVDRVLPHVDIINALMGKQLAKHAAPPGALGAQHAARRSGALTAPSGEQGQCIKAGAPRENKQYVPLGLFYKVQTELIAQPEPTSLPLPA